MHELSLAKSLIDQIISLAQEHKAKKVTKVTVMLGPFSGVVADSFDFGFNVLKKDQTITKEAILVLDTPPPTHRCLQCDSSFTEEKDDQGDKNKYMPKEKIKCPFCDSDAISPQGGTELILQQLEME